MISTETGGTPPEIDGRKRVCKMSEYQLKTPKKVEEAVVGSYHKIEDTVVGAYKKVEKKFVDTFLEPKEDSEESDRLQHDSAPLDQG